MSEKFGTVLVTGAGGYIASHIIKLLLEKGYTVRGTCRDRSSPKNAYLHSLPGASERLSLHSADLLSEGAFDEVCHGCDYVFHTASPVIFATKDPQKDLFDPALKGTLNVLKSCSAARVKRVVLTASVAGVLGMCHEKGVGHEYDENDWTDDKAIEYSPYNYSKKIAEKAAWDYWESLPAESRFELVAINPGIVLGPPLSSSLPESVSVIMPVLEGLPLPDFRYSYIDVRDTAKLHVMLLEDTTAKGRHIVHSESDVSFWRLAQLAKGLPGASPSSFRLPKVFQYVAPLVDKRVTFFMVHNQHGNPYKVSNKKVADHFHFEYIPLADTLADTVAWMVENKHLKKK